MILKLKHRLIRLFLLGILSVFTVVFYLLAYENIETKRGEEVSFVNRQAMFISSLVQDTSEYAAYLHDWEDKWHFMFRLSDDYGNVIYKSPSGQTVSAADAFLRELSRTEQIVIGEEGAQRSQSGIHTIFTDDGGSYYGVLSSFRKNGAGQHLVILQARSGWEVFLPLLIRYVVVWLAVAIAVWFISALVIRKALVPTEQAMQSQKAFIAAASHELKAPLAGVLSSADRIEALTERNDKIRHHVDKINGEVFRMKRLVEDLLLLSSMDAGNWTVHKSEVNVDTLALNLYEKYEGICAQKMIPLRLEVSEADFPPLNADEDRLVQLIGILMDNAITYSPVNSPIVLSIEKSGNKLVIQVIDHGIGIREADKAHIFDRFYQCDKSRTEKDHFGLGLSIARELVQRMKGTLELKDTEGGGCTFVLSITY